MRADELCGLLLEKGMKASAAKTLKEGLALAEKEAGADGIILATGSLYFIGALRSELGLKQYNPNTESAYQTQSLL
jgi:dihydrofolate synthase/folylpolyglutamate synthase